ncbi:tyrosine-type recombinase/integrase [Paludibaculum fermentans]|uniref:tyrosine-type recombinase/integrase n=1 Tax=Paludibaculum fermentans TaxID=1473598 RepID=UPI003EB6CD42
MSLLKRGNVYWSYFYMDGVRHQASTGTSNRRQAEIIESKLKEEANARRFQVVQADPRITFGQLAARFIASGIAHKHHLYHLKFLLPFFSDMPVLRLTKPMAEEFRKVRRLRNKAIKDATVNRDLSVLRHILYWAVDEQLIQANPLARLKMARERKIRRAILSVAEEDLLLTAAPPHLKLMAVTALDTGLRRGEITQQLWEDVDLARRVLSVTRSKTPEGEAREIPLTDRLFDLLSEHRQEKGNVVAFRGESVRIIKRSWAGALRRANIRHLRFHDLRHTFNTRLMEAGVLQEVRMALMGHSTGNSVHAIYTHIELPTKRAAIRKLEVWVNQQRQELKSKKEHDNASPQGTGTESGSGQAAGCPQTMEEEDAG